MPAPPIVLFLCSGNYYRSRFAEFLFNHVVMATPLPHRADSAGLVPNCRTRNTGAIANDTLIALQARGIPLPTPHREPRDVTLADMATAAHIVALKESEHRPLVSERFPEHLARVEFWQVGDQPAVTAEVALPQIEHHVRDLIARLLRA